MDKVRLAIIGGSGLYAMEGVWDVKAVRPDTPFGAPSDEITLATLDGVRLAFLPRHGRGHRLLPTEVPTALKDRIFSTPSSLSAAMFARLGTSVGSSR